MTSRLYYSVYGVSPRASCSVSSRASCGVSSRASCGVSSRASYGVSPRASCGVSPRVSMRVNKPRAKQTLTTVRRSLSLGREMTSDFLTLACYNAIATGQLGLLKAIYKTGKAPQVDKQGNTPLHVAAKCGQLRSLRWLLVHSNTPLLAKNSRGETCAHVASLQGQLKCLQAIVLSKLEKASTIACERDNMGMTVLHHATIGNRDVVVTWLLQEFGKDICLVKSCDGVLAIHLAAAAGNKTCTELLARGCKTSVNMRDVFGATSVFYSAQEGNLSCLQYLLEHADGSLNMIAFEGMTSFLSAAEGGYLDVVKFILEKQGHDALLSTTIDGATVFHYVCSVGNVNILKFLLELPDIAELLRVSDAYDRTPAHDAAEQGHVFCLKLLMEAGLSVYLPDKDGATPLSLALQSGNPNCVLFAKAVADSTLDKTSMKNLKKKLGSKFNHVSNIMMIQALSKDDAHNFKKSRLCKKKMGQYESSHDLSDILAFKQAVPQPHLWPQWHQTLQCRRPSRNSNRGIFRGEFILMRSSPPGTCTGRDRRRMGSSQNGYLYAQRNKTKAGAAGGAGCAELSRIPGIISFDSDS